MSAGSSQYIDRKTVNESYRPKSGTMSPGLKRARAPYRIKNALTGVALGAFAVGVWAYSISAVKQDVFDDVDEEARAMAQTGLSVAEKKAASTVSAITNAAPVQSSTTAPEIPATPSPPSSITPSTSSKARGILQHLDSRFPRLLDPKNKTLVWGAPPVDNIGKL